MKNNYLAPLFLAAALTAGAQSKFDAPTQMLMNIADNPVALTEASNVMSVKAPSAADGRMAFIVTCRPEIDLDAVEALGIDVQPITPSCFIATTTLQILNDLAAMDDVLTVNANQLRVPAMDKARVTTGVDNVHAGTGLDMPYTGKGVIVGLMDTGIDPNHSNFFNADEDVSRVQRFWNFPSSNGTYQTYDSESVLNFTTDNAKQTHGTHVAGIMAGSYESNSTKVARLNASGQPEVVNMINIPFKGVATEADIVMNGGALYDANILQAVGNAVQYAQEEGKPLVMNMSLGHNSGPHDGSDAFSRVLSELGKKAIICISAGNEGEDPIAIRKTFTEEDNTLRTFITDNKLTGVIDMWSADATPFKASWVIYETVSDRILASFDTDDTKLGQTLFFGNTSAAYPSSTYFDNNFKGYISLSAGPDANSKRWHVYTAASVTPLTSQSRYVIGLVIEGKPGQTVYVYGNEESTFTDRHLDWDNGGYDGTINGMACAQNVIAIGSYATRTSWATLGKTKRQMTSTNGEGDISRFSSWGTLVDGRTLPHICAPGEAVVSSINSYYAKTANINNMVATAYGLINTTDYWDALQGTSMASPLASGIVALWLQANPYLGVNEVIEVMQKTAIRDDYVLAGNPVAWGAGKIDAYEGLKYAKQMSGMIAPDANDPGALMLRSEGGVAEAFVAGARHIAMSIVGLQGATVASAAADGDTVTIATAALQPGIYVATVDTELGRISRKIVIK